MVGAAIGARRRRRRSSGPFQGSPAGVRALPWDVARLADADRLRSLLGEGSPKIHHPLAVPDRGGSRARIRSGGRGSIRPLVRGNQL